MGDSERTGSDREEATEEAGKALYLAPVIAAGKVVVLFFDVATLMVRLLFNCLVHDSTHGKPSLAGDRDGAGE